MAHLFQVRGTQLDAYVTQGKKNWYRASANGQVPSLVADGSTAGVFGGSKIDVRGLIGPNGIGWPFIGNMGNTGPMSYHVRVVPTFTGNPAAVQLYGHAFGSDGSSQGFYLRHNTNGTLNLAIRDQSQGDRVNIDFAAYSSAVAGTPMDIVITWNGSNTANSVKCYIAKHGDAMALHDSKSPSGAFVQRDTYAVNSFNIGIGVFGSGAFYLVEANFWNEVIDPTTWGVKSDFYTATAFEGFAAPAASTVVSGNTILGVAGTAVVPAAADVRSGTNVGTTTGTLDLPAESNVSAGVQYDNNTKTGTRQVVTNVIAQAVLTGQQRRGILRQR